MNEIPTRQHDRRINNVSLVRRGKIEHGALCLSRYHLTFSFTQETQPRPDTVTPNKTPALDHSSSSAADSSELSSATSAPPSNLDHQASPQPKSRGKTKTLWIGYPMINHCTLRPSHAQRIQSRIHDHYATSSDHNDTADDLFPPTVGTSSYNRTSTDSARHTPYMSPHRTASPAPGSSIHSNGGGESGRPPAIRIRCRDFQAIALHFHRLPSEKTSPDDVARQVFFELRSRCCADRITELLAFSFTPPQEEMDAAMGVYDARREYSRMGIGGKAKDGPGTAWRISDINHDYSFSPTYPNVICVPRSVSDNMLKYGGSFRSRARIPCLSYLHFNGGSITRSSQPLVGMQGKRNPQDERLVSAIFSSHTPSGGSPEDSSQTTPTLAPVVGASTLDFDSIEKIDDYYPQAGSQSSENAADNVNAESAIREKSKIYGSTRRNYIVDARPKMNVIANRATGGGIEDISNYIGPGDMPIEKVFLNIANIHVMRSSLEKIVESLGNSDYIDLAPAQELLRKSGWLGHIAGLIEGADLVARVVGLGGSHALIHCSDGWDRTSQVSALAQIMLDPYYRTLQGFITLVQKDFLSFGHKFRDRHGIQGSEKWFEIENERITPAKSNRDLNSPDNAGLNVLGSKALTGAKNWFEKNRSNLFRQQNSSREDVADGSTASSPPANPILHSTATPSTKEAKKHETKTDEIAPIFHQFLDALYQILHQRPNAFEFNEKFLLRLLYQSYSTQYGEFLFNNEQERAQQGYKTPSVWAHFLARKEFVNPNYTREADDDLLLPERGADRQIEVRWWHRLFGREDREMNDLKTTAATLPPSFTTASSTLSYAPSSQSSTDFVTDPSDLKLQNYDQQSDPSSDATQSAAGFQKVKDTIKTGIAGISIQSHRQPRSGPQQSSDPPAVTETSIAKDVLANAPSNTTRLQPQREDTDPTALAKYTIDTATSTTTKDGNDTELENPPSVISADSSSSTNHRDPLGAIDENDFVPEIAQAQRITTSQNQPRRGLDFAAFASQNAFSDR